MKFVAFDSDPLIVAGQMKRLAGPCRPRGHADRLEPLCRGVPHPPLDDAGNAAAECDRGSSRIRERFQAEVVDLRQALGAECAVEPVGDHRLDHVPRRRHGFAVAAASGRASGEHANCRLAHLRRRVGDRGRSEQEGLDVVSATDVEGLDHAGPMLDAVGGEPFQKRLPRVFAEHRDQFASRLLWLRVDGRVGLEQRNEHREGVLASPGELAGGRRADGGRVAPEFLHSLGQPTWIAAAESCGCADGGHHLGDGRIAGLEQPLEPVERRRVDTVADVGEQFEFSSTGRVDRRHEPAEPLLGRRERLDLGCAKHRVEQILRRTAGRGGEGADDRLLQRIERRVGSGGRHRGHEREEDCVGGRRERSIRCGPRDSWHGERRRGCYGATATPSRRRQTAICSATAAGAVEPKLAIRSTARDAPRAPRNEPFQPA